MEKDNSVSPKIDQDFYGEYRRIVEYLSDYEADFVLDTYESLIIDGVISHIIEDNISKINRGLISGVDTIDKVEVKKKICLYRSDDIRFQENPLTYSVFLPSNLFYYFNWAIETFIRDYYLKSDDKSGFNINCNLKELISAYYAEKQRLEYYSQEPREKHIPNYIEKASVTLDVVESIRFYCLWQKFEEEILDGVIPKIVEECFQGIDLLSYKYDLSTRGNYFEFDVKSKLDISEYDIDNTFYIEECYFKDYVSLIKSFLEFYGIGVGNVDPKIGHFIIDTTAPNLIRAHYLEKKRIDYCIDDGSIRKLEKKD